MHPGIVPNFKFSKWYLAAQRPSHQCPGTARARLPSAGRCGDERTGPWVMGIQSLIHESLPGTLPADQVPPPGGTGLTLPPANTLGPGLALFGIVHAMHSEYTFGSASAPAYSPRPSLRRSGYCNRIQAYSCMDVITSLLCLSMSFVLAPLRDTAASHPAPHTLAARVHACQGSGAQGPYVWFRDPPPVMYPMGDCIAGEQFSR